MGAELQLLDVFVGISSAHTSNPNGFTSHAALCQLISGEGEATLPIERSSHATISNFGVHALTLFLKSVEAGLGEGHTAVTTVYCNTSYLADAINKWIPNWKRNGWMTKAGTPVKQREAWEEIERLLKAINGSVIYQPAGSYATNPDDPGLRMGTLVEEASKHVKPSSGGGGAKVETYTSTVAYKAKPAEPPKPKEPEPVLAGQGLW